MGNTSKLSSYIDPNEILEFEYYIDDVPFIRYVHIDKHGKEHVTRYFVSKDGRIYSELNNRIMKPSITRKGYEKISIFYGGKGKAKPVTVHKMVALTYHRDQYHPGYDVNHKDGNKRNNHADNLEWVTRQENILHAFRTGLKHGIGGEKCVATLYSDETVLKAFALIKSGKSIPEASKITGIPLSNLYILARGESRPYLYKLAGLDDTIYKHDPSVLDPMLIYEIAELYSQGLKPAEIMSKLDLSIDQRNSVYRILSRLRKCDSIDDYVLDSRLTTPTTIGQMRAEEEHLASIQ